MQKNQSYIYEFGSTYLLLSAVFLEVAFLQV